MSAEVVSERLAPFTTVFAHGLAGESCFLVTDSGETHPVPVRHWQRPADALDHAMLGACVGPTIDIGCGPGRLTAALAERGHPVLGIDISNAAVSEAQARGGSALRRDVFEPLPGEGRWNTALLADGNVGIGGDPVALLRRIRRLLAREGRVVVEVEAPETRSTGIRAHLECDCSRTDLFDWYVLSHDDIADTARSAGLRVLDLHGTAGRWWAVLEVA